ncbi:hypothetical protein BO70DRAFT_432305 [Aspergillus heteromorphus CBS 117.55]|uniref:Rhodopsin domain-containing protein n=1 Tax=Aspergillus heteromorphus CBS 117.55 TaxID=1448321 RepID=A0A317V885_9EURO|nr:uncharacterized protein BO70DRAFT_432305 [Aspergillus heteromorphus CBS 117.55]PWY70265.1 hypothetical protein BO70DRAFT_432305 [Aspergillus heteromorphus CBS 117.55]
MTSTSTAPVDYWQYEAGGLALTVSMMVIASLSVVLRFIAVAKKKRSYGADDGMIVASLLSFYGFSIVQIWAMRQGGFRLPLKSLPQSMAAYYIVIIFSVPAISFAKLSILCLYYRIFVSAQFRVWVIIVGLSVVMWMVGSLVATILHCIPPDAMWNLSKKAHCTDFILPFEIIEPINCLQDIVIALMPIGMIKGLHLDLKQRVSLCFIFVLGGLVAVISLIRIVLIASPNSPPERIYATNDWLTAQLCVAIVCANLLTYRPLLPQHLVPRRVPTWFSRLTSKRRSSSRRSTDFELAGGPCTPPRRNTSLHSMRSDDTTNPLCAARRCIDDSFDSGLRISHVLYVVDVARLRTIIRRAVARLILGNISDISSKLLSLDQASIGHGVGGTGLRLQSALGRANSGEDVAVGTDASNPPDADANVYPSQYSCPLIIAPRRDPNQSGMPTCVRPSSTSTPPIILQGNEVPNPSTALYIALRQLVYTCYHMCECSLDIANDLMGL